MVPPASPPDRPPPPEPELSASRRIFRTVLEHPGIHMREIERRAQVGYGAVAYHLRKLEADGLIRSQTADQFKVYFAADFPKAERALAVALRSEPARKLFVSLLSLGEITHGELASVTGLGLSTVSNHARRLARAGFLTARRDGRRTFFALADRAAVERALIRHGHSLGDAALDAYITVWGEWRRPRQAKPAEDRPGPADPEAGSAPGPP